MKLHSHMSVNGKVEAPSINHGASTLSTPQTRFPSIKIEHTFRSLLYYGSRHFIGGITLLRWLLTVIIIAGLLWLMWGGVEQWMVSALFFVLWGTIIVLYSYWKRDDFVQFSPQQLPAVAPMELDPAEKIPFFATGFLSVENKEQRFTWLPAFYRTFATREHALMCYVEAGSRIGVGHWPDNEIGLWYLFFHSYNIANLAWGNLTFGRTSYPTVAITHQRKIPSRGRFRPEKTITETVFLAMQNEEDGKRILADLLCDVQL